MNEKEIETLVENTKRVAQSKSMVNVDDDLLLKMVEAAMVDLQKDFIKTQLTNVKEMKLVMDYLKNKKKGRRKS